MIFTLSLLKLSLIHSSPERESQKHADVSATLCMFCLRTFYILYMCECVSAFSECVCARVRVCDVSYYTRPGVGM